MPQLSLDLGHRASFSGENFLIAPCNQAAVAWLDRWPDWPGPGLAVYGPPGCGKTHLAHVFQAGAKARLLAPADLGRAEPPHLVREARAVALDGEAPLPERALLHLYNYIAENRGHLLLLSRQPPARWSVHLPDLASRLSAMPAVAIEPPDEVLASALLVKLFADRQLAVAPEVVAYLTPRLDRSFEALRRFVDLIDEESLARHRNITLPLARELVERERPR
jgi:chromosomal replication initiation ATPase DnaA